MKTRFLFVFAIVFTLASTSAFGQADWTQRFPATSPSARANQAMVQMGNNVVLFGGEGVDSNGNTVTLGDTWIWDGTNWSQITSFGIFGTGAKPPARSRAGIAYHPSSGKVVMFSGVNSSGLLTDTWVLELQFVRALNRSFYTWAQVTTNVTPPARESPAMNFDVSSGNILLTEGSNFSGDLQDTWAFNPGSGTVAPSWTTVSSINPNPPRDSATLVPCAIDTQHAIDRMLLFGGLNISNITLTPLGDNWIFRTNTLLPILDWGQATVSPAPSPRFSYAMEYYPISNQDVLYGGGASGLFSVFGDTWNATCGTWTQASPAHNPGLREFHRMAYSNAKFNIVMFGGRKVTNTFSLSNETWTWGRRAACLPTDGAEIEAGTEVTCQFDQIEGTKFGEWDASGFSPRFHDRLKTTFRAHGRGSASITAYWTDSGGSHSMTYNYTVTRRHGRDKGDGR